MPSTKRKEYDPTLSEIMKNPTKFWSSAAVTESTARQRDALNDIERSSSPRRSNRSKRSRTAKSGITATSGTTARGLKKRLRKQSRRPRRRGNRHYTRRM